MKKYHLVFSILASISLVLATPAFAFSDLPENHQYHFPLSYLQEEGIIEGYSDDTVRPDNSINRAELMKVLVEGQNLLEGLDVEEYKDCFPDVKEEWFAVYVCFAYEKDWVKGYPDETFKPEQTVNKVEALKMIFNSFELPTSTPEKSVFQDTSEDEWYMPYLQTALDKNLIEEKGQTHFYPAKLRTRGQISEIVARIMQLNYMDDPAYTDTIKAEFQTYLLLNALRKESNVTTTLKLNPYLTKAARAHAQDMAETIGDMSHQGSDGSQPWDRIRSAGLQYTGRAGENVGKGTTSTSRSILQAITDVHKNIFMTEPDGECNHRTTILSTCLPFTEVGIGVYSKNNIMYFTEDFLTE